MTSGRTLRAASYPRPSLSIAPGRKFATTTSDFAMRRSAASWPSSDFRSRTRLRWLRLASMKKVLTPLRKVSAPAQWRSHAPAGASTFTTSAPRSARCCTAAGPRRNCVNAAMRTPSSVRSGVILEGSPRNLGEASDFVGFSIDELHDVLGDAHELALLVLDLDL